MANQRHEAGPPMTLGDMREWWRLEHGSGP